MNRLCPSVSFIVVVVLAAQLIVPCLASCQTFPEEREAKETRASKYYISLGPEDELMIKVNVWGQIAKPGQYLVPSGTDLVALLSYAGGPTENAKINDVQIVRSSEENPKVISVDIKRYMETGDASSIPVLMPGDTVMIPATVFHMFSRFVGFVSQMAIIANVYYLLFVRK